MRHSKQRNSVINKNGPIAKLHIEPWMIEIKMIATIKMHESRDTIINVMSNNYQSDKLASRQSVWFLWTLALMHCNKQRATPLRIYTSTGVLK